MIHVYQVVTDTNIGGAGRYLINYVRHFDRSKFHVTVLIPENSALKKPLMEFSDISLIEVPFMADKTYDARCVRYLTELFRNSQIDILHTHASLSARIAARIAGVKTIISTRHCIEPAGRFPISFIKRVINNLLCDIYIAVSDAVKENLLDSGISAKKIRTVSNGVTAVAELPAEEKKKLREQYNVTEETVFGIFARLEPVKGHTYFIEAAKQFLQEGHKGKFLIVGNGSLEESLKAQAEGISEIIFTGYVPDTSEFLNLTDVNVLSSQSEAMSLAILEAMSLGKPTVATDVGGNGQLVFDGANGILTTYTNVDELKNAFIKMAEDKIFYHTCSERAKEMYMRSFRADIMVQNLETLYEEVHHDSKR